jgi:hypothetical protein
MWFWFYGFLRDFGEVKKNFLIMKNFKFYKMLIINEIHIIT